MKNLLPDPVPGFDQPIAVLKHCHDRIRKQLNTLHKLLTHLPVSGTDLDAKQAANAVMKYFNQAAGNHHADEEQDLLPMLQATARGDDAALLHALLPDILREHGEMEALWQALDRQLHEIASGTSAQLSADDVARFSALYLAHMKKEESHIAPMAKRLFSDAQMAQLGDAMRARRNVQ
ncbi:hemerythrin domain-containing protein [Noviherbaspirillum massiliense]|uniref:hemerythrin domain-containing protein n=1 Tax=Noviherbaspirillum massiliense TaxID=1465823 RepID=UPI0002E2B797|nr:hemerythrin domain-containing protein [Noviherbaspirillum massiliense]